VERGRLRPELARQFGWALSVIERLMPAPDARVFDIGCGDGKVTIELARRVPRGSVVGVDSSPAMIELAKRSWGEAAPNLEFLSRLRRDGDHSRRR
jgi:ubiquinone/menaquinone biosynthesis C-methylase UbiE